MPFLIDRSLELARSILEKVAKGDTYPSLSYGTMTLLRQGVKREVQFLQVGDGSDTDIRIEVYAIPKERKVEGDGVVDTQRQPPEFFPDMS